MNITLEQVERLRTKADVSYLQAKEALEYSDGDLLDALIYLEEQGAIPRSTGGYYSTRMENGPSGEENAGDAPEPGQSWESGSRKMGRLERVRFWLLENEVEIWWRERPVTAMPVLILIVLLMLAFWAVVPLAVLGLFCGVRFRFSGPDLERDDLNNAMGTVADTASALGRQVMDELRSQHNRSWDKPDDEPDNREE